MTTNSVHFHRPEACYLGWQESLEFLAKLVEPEIPN